MAPNLTSKGQVTIPKKVRDYLGLKAGAAVAFQRLDSGEIAIRAARGPQTAFQQVRQAARTTHRAYENRGDSGRFECPSRCSRG